MSDLEQRLTDALARGADEAPSPVGLAQAARARAARKRRTRIGGAAAAVGLCLAVPAAVVATRGSDATERPGPSQVATDSTPAPGVPGGLRVESWHGVTALVPDTWAYGSLADWCAGGGKLEPRVERPGGVSLDIRCATSTYGLSFQQLPAGQDRDQVFDWPVTLQTSKGWPPDAYVGAHGIGDVLVQVVAPTAEQAQEILGTVQPIGPVGDLNGCHVDLQTTPSPPSDGMRVCRYDALAQLEQSELLTGDDADAAEAALGDAPTGSVTYCPRRKYIGQISMVSADIAASVDLGCGDLSESGSSKQLTSEVLYWALSPGWSGSLPAGVPLPSELRRS